MAIQTIKGGSHFPPVVEVKSASGAYGFTFDNGTDVCAVVCRIPESGSVTAVEFRTGAKTTFPTNGMRITIEGVDGNGYPDGTPLANADVTLATGSWTANAWNTATFASAVSVTKGQPVAIVWRCTNTGDTVSVVVARGMYSLAHVGFAYGAEYPSGSWQKTGNTIAPNVALSYSGTYYPIAGAFAWSPASIGSDSFASANKQGNRIQFPMPVRARGCYVQLDASILGDFNVKLYDASGNAVANATMTTAQDGNWYGAASGILTVELEFNAAVNPSANVLYGLMVEPTSATNVKVWNFSVATAALMDTMPMGQNCYKATLSGTTFTNTTTTRYFLGLILDGFDDGVSAGGGAAHILGA